MVWVWPPSNKDHDPLTWETDLGKFNYPRWKRFYSDFFEQHQLVHNRRHTQRICISKEKDGAFAVVDIDTLWRRKHDGKSMHWKGRVCKVYAKVGHHWKLTMHTGVLEY